MTPVITSIGILSPLGLGRETFAAAWRAGDSAPRVTQGAETGGVRLPKYKAATLFPEHRKSLRRMDRLSKLVCSGVAWARDDRQGLGERDGLGLAVGTDFGTLTETWKFLTRLKTKGPALCNPMDFPNLVPNAGAGYAGIFLGLRGPSHTFCAHETCGDEAIAWIADGIAAGWIDAGLGGGAEELGETRALATLAARGWSHGAPPGEGAAMVLLETPERAKARGATVVARYLGSWGASMHVPRSALLLPEQLDPLISLIARALDGAGVHRDAVGVVLLSHPSHPGLFEAVRRALGRDVPQTDHPGRVGVHPADGAFRVALASLLLADRSLPVHADADGCQGSAALVVTCARGGGLRVTVVGAP